MPSLDEVVAEFPREPLLLHIKSDDPAEGEALARRLCELDGQRLARPFFKPAGSLVSRVFP
ncbi:hypothetical protein [Saccharopolyspora sp. ASAGF58]|uniref:hypothetical protein n=1 Tax=Saccharopolyspora sp. ASAGF58 TaxID=2719023 RepID=UPI001FF0B5ED|nr:hypothetical protein [Saccharopolyspora sp. ASAGF58]